MSEKLIPEDPCDSIDINDLEGWTRYDSDKNLNSELTSIDFNKNSYSLPIINLMNKK